MDDYKERLIELVRQRPILWNPRVPDYKDKDLKAQVWKDLANILTEPTGSTHRDAWESLLRCHWNALQRRRKRSVSGADTASARRPWKFMKQLEFIVPVRDVRTNLKGQPPPEASDEETIVDRILQAVKEEAGMEEADGGERHVGVCDVSGGDVGVGDVGAGDVSVGDIGDDDVGVGDVSVGEQAVGDKRKEGEQGGRRQPKRRKGEDKEEQFLALMRQQLEARAESPRMGFFHSVMPRVDTLDEDLFHEFQLQTLLLLKNLHDQQNQHGHLYGPSGQ